MVDVASVQMPLPYKLKLNPLMEKPLSDPTLYRQLIGKLNFLLHTRPDTAFAVQYLSQFNQTPYQTHFDVALHVLKYLKGTVSQGIFFNNKPVYNIEAYCDSDWASCPFTHRSRRSHFVVSC
uniref:Reverse transcriptase Ty1/copia-type domain-containing protein n=1 Tax=Lactuca sativa TaxID=4236 RepID=A0A9R1W235_LACSA|nr:hypothetical protein LSAT_V11C300121740 [Lactuca sativa]